MVWYYYLAYKIYVFYRKRNDMPVFYSFAVTTTLVSLNLICAAGIVDILLIPIFNANSKYYCLMLMILVAIINYLILFRKRVCKEIFNYLDRSSASYCRWDRSVRLYVVFSVAFLLVTLIAADLRNHGYF